MNWDPEINVKLDDGAFLPERAHDTDAGADVCTPVDFYIEPHSSCVIHTGIHVETPPHCGTMIKSKSGLYIKHDITATGVVDEGYDGEVVVKLLNHGPYTKTFMRGDKIAQLVVVPVIYPTYVEAEKIISGERGSNGFGSTGR